MIKKLSKINKILIAILVVLVLFIAQQKITEQDRVEYYICYEWAESHYSMTHEEIKDRCKGSE